GIAVTIPTTTLVTSLGLIGRKAGPAFKMALYEDNGGAPDGLLTYSEVGNLVVGPQAVAVAPTQIPAGTFWVMAIFETDAQLPANNALSTATIRYRSLDFADPLPSPFGPSTDYTNGPINHYIKAIP